LNNHLVEKQIGVERKVLNLMEGGCQLPLGVFCDLEKVFVSYAKDWTQGARNFEFPYSENTSLAEEIVAMLKVNA
jgi:hydroxymethylbilane synthase